MTSPEPRSVPTDVAAFLDSVTPAVRQRDARTLLDLMLRITGEPPRLDRSMIGFGTYRYHYPSGRTGETAAAGFAPRRAAMSIYFMDGLGRHETALSRLGPHKAAVGCLYVTNLAAIDLAVLEAMIADSYAALTAGTWKARARDGQERDSREAPPLPAIGAPAMRAMRAEGYETLDSLADVRAADLLALHGVGPKAIRIIREALAADGLAPLR